MHESEKLVSELTARYQRIMAERGAEPQWAVHKRNFPNELVSCTIPFVGRGYAGHSPRILVYASAENLGDYYTRKEEDTFDSAEWAINRHRYFFSKESGFFPKVHLGPMDCGALSTAVAYIAMKLTGEAPAEPREFYEAVAFGNYGKYSMETELQANIRQGNGAVGDGSNYDYPTKNPKLLAPSHDFLRADIEVLKPEYIIMPKTVYQNDMIFMNSVRGNATIIPIYQINSGVVHRTIKSRHAAPQALDPVFEGWCDKITSINRECYPSVFTYLDSVLRGLGLS